jgi:putative ABC transport system permease protein
MAWLIASLRRLRDERSSTVALSLLVFVTAFVFAVTPRVFERIADDAVQTQVREASSFDRDIQLLETGRIDGTQADPLGQVDDAGASLQARLPASVGSLIDDRSVVVDSIRWAVAKTTADPSFMRVRVQPDVDAHLSYADGRAPTGDVRQIANPLDSTGGSPKMPVFEIAMSRSSAKAIGASLGDIVPLTPDPTDDLIRGDTSDLVVAGRIVGVYDVPNATDAFWMGDTTLVAPSYRGTILNPLVDVTAVLATDAYPKLLAETVAYGYPARYTWRYRVDPGRIQAAATARLLVDLRRLESTFASSNNGVDGTTLRSGLLPLIKTWSARWDSATTLLGVIAIGPIVVAIAALAMVVLLVVARRRPSLALSRGRGASTGQVVGSSVAEGLLVTIPAAVVAVAASVLIIPAGSPGTSILAAFAIALAATVLMVLAMLPTAVAAPRGPGRGSAGGRRTSTRRVLLEGFVVLLAIAGAYVLRERGVHSVASVGSTPASDPLIAAVPALAGVAAGLILVRLLPLPIRLLGRLAGRRRDLVPVLAMRRASGGGSAGAVLLVLMAATAIAAFSLTTLLHFDQAADDVAWQQVGAPYHVGGSLAALPSDLDPATFPEVAASAAVFSVRSTLETRRLPLDLIAIDVAHLAAVVHDTPADPNLPPELLIPRVPVGSAYPVIVSEVFGEGTQALHIGDTFTLPIEARTLTFKIVEIRPRYPGLPDGVPFVIASRDQLRADRTDGFRTNTAFYVRADDSAETAAAIRANVRDSAPFAVVQSRAEQTTDLRTSPIIDAIVLGVALAGLLAAAYAAISISAALALAGTAQAVEVAHLRTMGMTRREAFGLVIVEHGPMIVIGFVAGLAFGFLLFGVVQPGLGLDTLVGSTLEIPVSLGADQVVAIATFVIAIAALGIGLGAFLQRRAIPASAIRRGFE